MATIVLSITAPASVPGASRRSIAIPGVSLSEPDALAGETVSVEVYTKDSSVLTATGPGVSTSPLDPSILMIEGSLAQVNADLATLAVSEPAEEADVIYVDAMNSLGDTAPPSQIDVTSNAPGLSITAPVSVTGTRGRPIAVPGVSLFDPDSVAGESFVVTVDDEASTSVLTATGNSGAGITGSGTSSLIISGSLEQVNTDLAALSVNEFSPGADIIDISATDSLGESAVASGISVTTHELVPVIAAPDEAIVTANVSTAIPGISLSEAGAFAGENFIVRVFTQDGLGLLTATGTGVSGVTGSGASLTFYGTLAQVNTDLAALALSEPVEVLADTLYISPTDSLGDLGPTANVSVLTHQLFFFSTIPAPVTVPFNVSTSIPDVSLSEAGNVAGEMFNFILTAPGSVLLTASGSVVSGSGTDQLTLTGSLADVNAALATLSVIGTTPGVTSIATEGTDSLGDVCVTSPIGVTVTAPTLSIVAPASVRAIAGRSTAIPGVSLSEPNALASETFSVQVRTKDGSVLTAAGLGVTTSPLDPLILLIGGTLAQVNADLATLAVSETTSAADVIYVDALDSLGNDATTSAIDVPSSAPGLSVAAPVAVTVTANLSTSIQGVSLSDTDAVANEFFTVTVDDDEGGLLTASGTGVAGVTGAGTARLTISGSLEQVNTDLSALALNEYATGVTDTLSIFADDSRGETAPLSEISVTANFLGPIISVPGPVTVPFNVATSIAGLSLSEAGNFAGETFSFSVTANAGDLLFTASGSDVSGSGTNQLTLSGSLADVNAALATLSVIGTKPGTAYFAVFANDSLGEGSGPGIGIAVTVAIPSLNVSAPFTLAVPFYVATSIPGLSLSEPGSLATETFVYDFFAKSGALLLTASGSGVSGSGTDDLQLSGSLAEVNAALATLSVIGTTAGTAYVLAFVGDSLGDELETPPIIVTVAPRTLSISAPATLAVAAGVSSIIPGVSVSEPGALADETFSVEVDTNFPTNSESSLTATGPEVYGSGTNSLAINGTLAQVNTELATLAVTEPTAGTDTIAVTAIDSVGGYTHQASIIDVTAYPFLLSTVGPFTNQVTAGAATAIAGISLSEPDSVAGETFTAVVTDPTGALTATGPGVSGLGTSELTVTGSLTQVNAALATLSDTEKWAGSASIVVRATDSFGDNSAPADSGVFAPGPVITAPAPLGLTTIDEATAIPGIILTDTTNVANETYSVTVSDAYGRLSATGENVAGDDSTALTVTGSLTDVNTALATLFDASNTGGSDTIEISATDSAGIAVRPAFIAVTTTPPVLPAPSVSLDDPSQYVTGFGSITDPLSGQNGSETSSATATGGLDPSVTASVSATGSGPPSSEAEATIQIYFEILGPIETTVPVIFSGTETTSASPGLFDAIATFTPPGTSIVSATYGTGPSGYPASQSIADRVMLDSDSRYSVTYDAQAGGPSPDGGSTGSATASVDPTIAIDPTFAQASEFTLISDEVPCFLAGTRILTERGEVPVEALAVGDRVVSLAGAPEPVVWIGRGRKLVTPGRRSDATPVLVREGALAPGVPHRDLRITKGHSLFIDGVLIPAEFLINHRSIVWDDRAREVEFYHVELARHDVLLADGAAAESYRDDGNRALFHDAGSGWHLPPVPPCAPVLTGGPVVDAVWRRVLDRAGPAAPVAMTDDPDLHLLVDGWRVDGLRRCGEVYLFPLPRRPEDVRVVSRSGVPSELGLARDPRRLGVALRRIMVWQGARLRLIEGADPSLGPGFHAFEPDNGFRWTKGDGPVPGALFDGISGPSEFELHVGCTTRYPLGASAARLAA